MITSVMTIRNNIESRAPSTSYWRRCMRLHGYTSYGGRKACKDARLTFCRSRYRCCARRVDAFSRCSFSLAALGSVPESESGVAAAWASGAAALPSGAGGAPG